MKKLIFFYGICNIWHSGLTEIYPSDKASIDETVFYNNINNYDDDEKSNDIKKKISYFISGILIVFIVKSIFFNEKQNNKLFINTQQNKLSMNNPQEILSHNLKENEAHPEILKIFSMVNIEPLITCLNNPINNLEINDFNKKYFYWKDLNIICSMDNNQWELMEIKGHKSPFISKFSNIRLLNGIFTTKKKLLSIFLNKIKNNEISMDNNLYIHKKTLQDNNIIFSLKFFPLIKFMNNNQGLFIQNPINDNSLDENFFNDNSNNSTTFMTNDGPSVDNLPEYIDCSSSNLDNTIKKFYNIPEFIKNLETLGEALKQNPLNNLNFNDFKEKYNIDVYNNMAMDLNTSIPSITLS